MLTGKGAIPMVWLVAGFLLQRSLYRALNRAMSSKGFTALGETKNARPCRGFDFACIPSSDKNLFDKSSEQNLE